MDSRSDGGSAIGGALKGALAGAAGVWLMDLVSTALYQQEPESAKKHEETARAPLGGKDPASAAAVRLAEATGTPLTTVSEGQAATAIHYALGVVPGALYGALRHRLPGSGSGRGLVYGLALFLLNDEVLGPALGLAVPPGDYPWQAHARGLAAHLVLGVATDAALDALDAIG